MFGQSFRRIVCHANSNVPVIIGRSMMMSCNKHYSSSNGLNKNNSTDEVLLESHGNKGVITLNRPKALNALNLNMIRQITPALKKWEEEEKVLIIIRGSGGKAFCAGGDVRSIVESKSGPGTLRHNFFYEEYQLNYLISTLQTPYIALIDGITMGGGVGLSIHGYYRVSSEKTLFSMPETAIGFVPDVGGTYFLPRLRGKLGLFLALTGHRLKGADVYHAGISTHAINSQDLNLIQEELLALKMNSQQNSDIEKCLAKYTKGAKFLEQPFTLAPHMSLIDECFSAPTVEEIILKLEMSKDPFAKETLTTLKKMSPLSLKITKKALDEGSELTLAECLRMEFRLSQRFVADHDFAEGVRALLIDKDQKPQWKPARLEECTAEKVNSYFDPIHPSIQEWNIPSKL